MVKAWVLAVLLLAKGCSALTGTPAPTPPPALTATPTRAPTPAPEPTPAADISVYRGSRPETSLGFSLEIPLAFEVDRLDAGLYASNRRLIYTFFTATYDGTSPLADSIHRFLDLLEDRGAGFDRGDPYDADLAGRTATALDFSGIFVAFPVTGKALAVPTADGRVFIAVGMAKTERDEQAWSNLGRPVFEQMLGTLSIK